MPRHVLCLSGLLLGLIACAPDDERASDAERPVRPGEILTTFYPTQYFAQRIVGDAVPVVCPVPEDADPIFWQPSRADLERYQAADLIVVNGAEFEKWVNGASLPSSRVVDTAKRFEDQFVTFESTTHRHGTGGQHTHEGIDGHTWLDPVLARQQAEAIAEAVTRSFPRHAATLRQNALGLYADLEALDRRFQEASEVIREVQLLASHPAYNYLARRYQWQITNFDLDPELPISDEQIASLKAALPDSGRALLLWEGDPLAESPARIEREIGVRSLVFSPAELLGEAERRAGQDWLSIQIANLERLLSAVNEL